MSIDWDKLCELIRAHQRYLLTTHVRPDGDALGAELAMYQILKYLGKQAWIVNPGPTPPRYAFLDSEGIVWHKHMPEAIEAMQSADALLILDTSAWDQVEPMAEFIRNFKATKIVLDHHLGSETLGGIVFKDTKSAACGLLVLELADRLGVPVDKKMALPLFVAIATDTGWFRYPVTKGHTLRSAARLLDAGIAADEVYRLLFEDYSLSRMKLTARVLERLQLALDGRVAYTVLYQADIDETGASPQDSEELVNYTMSLRGVLVGLLFTEMPGGQIRVSFRSRDGIDSMRLASSFGGGGHMQAAGATLAGSLEEVQQRVLEAVRAELERKCRE